MGGDLLAKNKEAKAAVKEDTFDKMEKADALRRMEFGCCHPGSSWLLYHQGPQLTQKGEQFLREEVQDPNGKRQTLIMIEQGIMPGAFCPRCGLTCREIRGLTEWRKRLGMEPVLQPCSIGPTALAAAREKYGDELDEEGKRVLVEKTFVWDAFQTRGKQS